jgi:two-component system, NarL family, sensor histidine kinase LiaS
LKRITPFLSTLKYENMTAVYRFFSWFFTSLFYLLNSPDQFNGFKFTVVALLLFSSLIIVWLYERVKLIKWRVIVILLVEMIGISLLLIPTGAFESPFLWYALNPVLLAAGVLGVLYSWLVLSFYLGFTVVTSYITLESSMHPIFLNQHSHLLLIFILITIAVQLLSAAKKELSNKNNQLEKQRMELETINQKLEVSNKQNQESIDHIMSLYQITEWITSRNSKQNLVKTFSENARFLSKTSSSFFWKVHDNGEKDSFAFSKRDDTYSFKVKEVKTTIKKLWINSEFKHVPSKIQLEGKTFLVTTVTSATRKYGVIGVELENKNEELKLCKQLIFLADLCSIVLERLDYESINHKMILLEEQNRIANEIHDSVSQRLFSIVYASHSLKRNLSGEYLQEQLSVIEDCSRQAAMELRECIYRLSSRKNEEKAFLSNLKKHLYQVSKLNAVIINLSASGDPENIPLLEKQRLYRLIKESVGNAIRHGKAAKIEINLAVSKDKTLVVIEDNGSGFDSRKIESKPGLGLLNMYELAELSNGSFQIDSEKGKGTTINVTLSHVLNKSFQEEIG